MKRLILAALAGLCLATFSPAAESVESQMKAFQQAATAALAKQAPATPGDRRGESLSYAVANLASYMSGGSNANPQEFERIIASITTLTQNDPAVAKAADTLLATVKAERQARIDKARADVDALLKQAGDACLAAKTPADLDATLTALAPYARNSGYGRRIDDQESWQRCGNAYRFVTRWQDYLAARGQRNANESANALRDLSGSVDTGMMPRSSILALISPPASAKPDSAAPANPSAEAASRLEKAKTLDEFIAASRALRAANPNNQYQQTQLQQVLTHLIEDRQLVLTGTRLYTLFSDSGSNRILNSQDPNYTEALQFSLLAFRRETQFAGIRLALAGNTLPETKPDDTPDTYLVRIIEKFVADNNWLQVRETLELYRTVFANGRTPSWLAGDIDACTAYLAARNLDLAAQYPAAIASYRKALRSTGRYVPVQAIGARLSELKKSNPEAFADSASDADTGAPTRSYGQPSGTFPPGYMPASMPRNTGAARPPAPTGPMTPAATP